MRTKTKPNTMRIYKLHPSNKVHLVIYNPHNEVIHCAEYSEYWDYIPDGVSAKGLRLPTLSYIVSKELETYGATLSTSIIQ